MKAAAQGSASLPENNNIFFMTDWVNYLLLVDWWHISDQGDAPFDAPTY